MIKGGIVATDVVILFLNSKVGSPAEEFHALPQI
jgi:hypothetical protein